VPIIDIEDRQSEDVANLPLMELEHSTSGQPPHYARTDPTCLVAKTRAIGLKGDGEAWEVRRT